MKKTCTICSKVYEGFDSGLYDICFSCFISSQYSQSPQIPNYVIPTLEELLKIVQAISGVQPNPSGATDMIYVHYEEIQAGGVLPLTKFVFSSSSARSAGGDKAHTDRIKKCVEFIKQIPISDRSFDAVKYTWTVHTSAFLNLRALWNHMNYTIDRQSYFLHADLKRWMDGLEGVVLEHEKVAPKPEDFFYSTSQPVRTPKVDKETARMLLVDFLIYEQVQVFANGDLIKSYKQAARKLHPDLNGGDASKMTQLNYLWQQYKELV